MGRGQSFLKASHCAAHEPVRTAVVLGAIVVWHLPNDIFNVICLDDISPRAASTSRERPCRAVLSARTPKNPHRACEPARSRDNLLSDTRFVPGWQSAVGLPQSLNFP
ncbi:hypothetical protein SKAU_G00309450 [Synaphobranchus kaupii]|uniref:Uncharacterized protein n=1 Tax=Synaphobranchus kaupii TaxID=118154 RepID=A0A9Q1IK58_SYNKA|nr:hypothetical protein SKAU_G00309450 [Synaphobranchus kaupii]